MKIRTGDPEMAREINRSLILNILREQDLLSRADIARALDLSKVTVSTIVSNLIQDELVEERGAGDSLESGGRKPIMLSLNSSKKYVIGVDIGTTSTAAATADLKGKHLQVTRRQIGDNLSVDRVLTQVQELIEQAIHKSKIDRAHILALGVSAAGIVNSVKGYIYFSPDFDWKDVDIKSLLEKKTGFPVVVDNCTRTMTLGEQWYGRIRDARNVLYVNVGYGIGSALILNKHIYSNHSEFGHSFITKQKIRCHCGKYGCLEAVASGNAIESQANELLGDKVDKRITAKMLATMARDGDRTARRIFQNAGRYLGRAISIATNLFNPNTIVIGGGVALAGELLLEPLVQEFDKQTMDIIRKDTRIELSSLGIDAGVSGAVALALNHFVFKSHLVNEVVR